MNKFTIYLSFIALFAMTSMVSSDGSWNIHGLSNHPDRSTFKKKAKLLVEKGMITIKVKKEIVNIPQQKGMVTFNMKSLDELSSRFQLESIDKRFRYNPSKLRKGLPDLSRIYKITFPETIPVLRVVDAFSKDPAIEYAEPIPINYLCEEPDDPYYYQQHFLPQIQAEEAWEIHKGEDGEEEVVIAIVDTGVDWDHEDLQANAWQNLGEDADGDGVVMEYDGTSWVFDPDDENGIDDDGNGYIDDFTGWRYFSESNDPNPIENWGLSWHGTLCAGLVASNTNNGIGIASISWNVSLMSLHIADQNGLQYAFDGIIYAAENGADIISNSWGSPIFSNANYEVVEYAIGLGSIVVGSAANENQYRCVYPAALPGVFSVASVSKTDIKASYSSFGPYITISAPGGEPGGPGGLNGIYSTMPNNGYGFNYGTSMAGPLAAGLLGLVKSYHPEWANEEIIAQVIGTADNIDQVNPDHIFQLGSGRINAFRALNESGVTLPQEIKLDIFSTRAKDLDNNGVLAPGDTVTFDLTLRNFSIGVNDPDATFTISCNDPNIVVSQSTHSEPIPSDNYFKLNNAFQIIIDENASTHGVEIVLISNSNLPIVYGDTLIFELMVAPGGILVYQGEGTGNAYSGEYIRDFLQDAGKDCYYTSTLPSELEEFDAVFISLGNYGDPLFGYGTPITEDMNESILSYLEYGGHLYLECGSYLGTLDYFKSPYLSDLMGLLSIDTFESTWTINNINILNGLAGSITDGFYFTGTNQDPCYNIDILSPNLNGKPALEENDYGAVAVQGAGASGQKTFMMNYAISKLIPGEPGMTEELLTKVCQYLGIDVSGGVESLVQGSKFKVQGYPNPTSSNFCMGVTLDHQERVSIQVFDILGNMIIVDMNKQMFPGENVIAINVEELEAGIYFCSLQIGGTMITKKFIKN